MVSLVSPISGRQRHLGQLPHKRPAKAMAAWARFRSSFSSLPTVTSPSSSSPSSSASLPPLDSLDLADELWFYGSVLSLPRFSLPCFPRFASPSPPPPDTSTLIAQCMFDGDPPPFLSSSSSASPRPPPHPEQTEFASWYLPAPREDADHKEPGYPAYNENAYYGYSSMSDSDDDESYFRGYPRPNAGEDEEAFHYYTAPSDWDEEDTYNGYPAPSDGEEEQPPRIMKGELPAYPRKPRAYPEPEDALSGIYDVAALLKGQHYEEMEEAKEKPLTVSSLRFPQETVTQVSALPHFQVSSGNDQADMKENLKLWAHAVALTLPWKAAAQARPLL